MLVEESGENMIPNIVEHALAVRRYRESLRWGQWERGIPEPPPKESPNLDGEEPEVVNLLKKLEDTVVDMAVSELLLELGDAFHQQGQRADLARYCYQRAQHFCHLDAGVLATCEKKMSILDEEERNG